MAAVACGPEESDDTPCVRQAPYRLVVLNTVGPLPRSTVLQIKHGAGEVDYVVASPPKDQELVFCTPEFVEGSSDVASLTCVLWTQGAAMITVKADGYESVEEQLALDRVEGCVVTQDVELRLKLKRR